MRSLLGIAASGRANAYNPSVLLPAVWLRAKDISGTDGSAVTTAPDQSPNANNVVLGNANNVTLALNSTPKSGKAFRFPGNAFFKIGSDLSFSSGDLSESFTAAKAFDQNSGTYWHSSGTTAPFYIGRKAGPTAQVATGYSIKIYSGTSNGPLTWEFQGSNSISGSWTTLDTKSVGAWASGESRSYTISNTDAYLYYRLYITSVGASTYARIEQISITGCTTTISVGMPATGNGEFWAVVKGVNIATKGSWVTGPVSNGHFAFSGDIYEGAGITTRQNFTPTTSITNWIIYRVTVEGTVWKAYINDVLQKTVTGVTSAWLTDNVIIGKSPGAGEYYLDALGAEFMLIPKALSSDENTSLYNYFYSEHIA